MLFRSRNWDWFVPFLLVTALRSLSGLTKAIITSSAQVVGWSLISMIASQMSWGNNLLIGSIFRFKAICWSFTVFVTGARHHEWPMSVR